MLTNKDIEISLKLSSQSLGHHIIDVLQHTGKSVPVYLLHHNCRGARNMDTTSAPSTTMKSFKPSNLLPTIATLVSSRRKP
jgi:hypothetical protein